MEKINIKVPTMGDSITEGTVVEWAAQIGQLVKEGDVVALVETDKVTIDIKAEVEGVITEQYGSIDENVEVGGDLYQIHTEGREECGGFFEVAAPEIGDDSPTEVADASTAERSASTRIPSIQFLGKSGWAKQLTPPPRSREADIAAGIPPAVGGPAPVIVDSPHLGHMYGRPAFSEREMAALLSGGAEDAPVMVSPSSAAKFAMFGR